MECQCPETHFPFPSAPQWAPWTLLWKSSWVRCKGVRPHLPSPGAQPRGLPTSLRSSGSTGMSGGHLPLQQPPLLPEPLEIREVTGRKQPCGAVGAARGGERAREKGQELSCLWGGLECVLWSGLPGAQVSMSPELPLLLRGPPRPLHSSEQGEGSRKLAPRCERTQFRLSFLFRSRQGILRETPARPGGRSILGG